MRPSATNAESVDSSNEGNRPQPARRRSPRGDAARERILRVALDSFADRGYRATSLNEIARLAGLSMPGLLHHFPSKDELFAAVMQQQEEVDRALFDDLTARSNPGAFEVLDGFVSMARINRGRYGFVQLMHLIAAESAGGEYPGGENRREHFRTARGFVERALERGAAAGEIRADVDVKTLSAQVVAMIEGLENQWLQEPETFDFVRLFEVWIEQLKDSIRV